MKEAIRFAIAGYGRVGERHAEIIKRSPGATLVAACDINPEKESCANGLPFYLSIPALLSAEKNIDIVSIATPNGLHTTHALEVLNAGKHVIIEKPMGLTKADCEQVRQKSLEMNRQVFCIMQNRYSPPCVWIKSVVESGRLGDIYMVRIDCFWNRDTRYYKKGDWKGTTALDGGTLFTQFSHFIDIMYWLFGDIYDIQANFFDFNHQQTTEFEDSGIVNFRFCRGGAGIINYSTSVWDKNFESALTIIAENGTVKIGGQYMNEILYCHIKNYSLPEMAVGNPSNDYGIYNGSAANHGLVFENVISVLNGEATITANALDGLAVTGIIENIYKLRQNVSTERKGFNVPVY